MTINNLNEHDLQQRICMFIELLAMSNTFLDYFQKFMQKNNLPRIKNTYKLTHEEIERFALDNLKELRNKLSDLKGE